MYQGGQCFRPCAYQCAKGRFVYLSSVEPYSSSSFGDKSWFTRCSLHSCGGNDDVAGVDSVVDALQYHLVTSLLLHDPFDCLKFVVVLTIFQKFSRSKSSFEDLGRSRYGSTSVLVPFVTSGILATFT